MYDHAACAVANPALWVTASGDVHHLTSTNPIPLAILDLVLLCLWYRTLPIPQLYFLDSYTLNLIGADSFDISNPSHLQHWNSRYLLGSPLLEDAPPGVCFMVVHPASSAFSSPGRSVVVFHYREGKACIFNPPSGRQADGQAVRENVTHNHWMWFRGAKLWEKLSTLFNFTQPVCAADSVKLSLSYPVQVQFPLSSSPPHLLTGL